MFLTHQRPCHIALVLLQEVNVVSIPLGPIAQKATIIVHVMDWAHWGDTKRLTQGQQTLTHITIGSLARYLNI